MAAPLSKNWTKQPPYRAQINSGHPLAAGLRFAHTGSAGLVDLISQKTATKNASDSIQSVNIPNLGPAVSFKGGRVIDGGIDYGTYQASKTGAITILAFANPTIGTAQTLFSQRMGVSPFAECALVVGYSYYANTITSGVISCLQTSAPGSSRSSTSSANTYPDGNFHAYAVTVQDGSSFPVIYFDGKSINVTTAGTGTSSFYNSAQKTRIGNVADYTAASVYAASCNIPLVLVWDRALSASEVAELSKNPWQLFRPQSQQLAFFSSALAPITGTLNVTEADDTLSSTGALAIAGSLSVTEASDSVSSTGALAIAGSLSVTEDSDTVSSAGVLALAGSLSVTEESDSLSSTGALSISGSLSVTEEGDTLSSTGSSATTGSLNVTEESDTLSSTGALAIAGSLAVTEASDTLAATGTLSISGSLNVTEEDDALTSTAALAISGSLSVTEDSDTLASAGASGATGSLNVTEEGDTLTATATVTQLVGGGGMGKQKRQRGWANERARLEASLKTETAAQEVKTATKILRASDSESARRVADLVREYESARATLEQLRDEVERLRVETDRSERLRDEVETAAKVVEIFAQEEAELLEILDIIDEMEAKALMAALGIAA